MTLVMWAALLLVVTHWCGSAAGTLLGDYSLWLPSAKAKAQLANTPFKPVKSGTRVGEGSDSLDETVLFDVQVPDFYFYASALASSGKAELTRLLKARLESESVYSGKGGNYKVWLSPSTLLVALRVFPVGYRTFVLRHEEGEEEDGGELVFSVVDLERGLGSQRCSITTRISLFSDGGSPAVKVSLSCLSRKLDAGLRKRLLKAVREAWSERLARDVGLCAARLHQLRAHASESSIAAKSRRKAENDKVLNPPKPISPTVRRPGGGGRVDLGSGRRAARNNVRVVRRGGGG